VNKGVLISEVMPNSPAEEAEIRSGDIIVGFGDKATNSIEELVKEIQKRKIGEKTRVMLYRGDEKWMADITLGRTP